jgi:hypothetical protein
MSLDIKHAILLLALIALAIVALRWMLHGNPASARPPPAFSSTTLVAHLRECSDLVTVRAPLSTVIEQTSHGVTGGARALLAMTIWLDVGCDLGQARILSTDTDSKTLRVAIPAPRVLAIGLDAGRTRVYDQQRTGLWHFIPGSRIEQDLINSALHASPEEMLDQSVEDSLVRFARDRTSAFLKELASASGWSVEIEWPP